MGRARTPTRLPMPSTIAPLASMIAVMWSSMHFFTSSTIRFAEGLPPVKGSNDGSSAPQSCHNSRRSDDDSLPGVDLENFRGLVLGSALVILTCRDRSCDRSASSEQSNGINSGELPTGRPA